MGASALGTTGGSQFLKAVGARLVQLLGADAGRSVEPATVAMVSYALARGGCAGAVDPSLWHLLAARAAEVVPQLAFTEAANLAAAFAQLEETAPAAAAFAEPSVALLFGRL